MKNRIFIIIVLAIALFTVAACGNNYKADIAAEEIPKTTVINTAPPRASLAPGLAEYREPNNRAEEKAMEFVDALWVSHKSEDSSFALLVPHSDPDLLSPYIPSSAVDQALGMLIANTCFAFQEQGSTISFHRRSPFNWNNIHIGSGAGRSLGITDVYGITSDTVVAVVFSIDRTNGESDIDTVLVGIQDTDNGHKIVPLPMYLNDTSRTEEMDRPIIFYSPSGTIVTFNGIVQTPSAEAQGSRSNDIYEIYASHYGVYEGIEVFLGEQIGTLQGFISADTSISGGSSLGYSGYGSSTIGISNNISTLAVTRLEFRGLRDELTERTQYITDRIAEALDNQDIPAFVALTHNPERFEEGQLSSIISINPDLEEQRIAPEYRARFQSWERREAAHGATNEVTIDSIEVIRLNTVRVTFSTLKTLKSGNQFIADRCQFVLEYFDDNWYITNMTNCLLVATTDVWELINS